MDISAFLEQSKQLKSFTPSPQDGKFATDLYYTLQHHLSLTLFQKLFLASTLFPLSFNLKLAFFSYLYALPPFNFPGLVVLIIIVALIVGWYFLRYLARSRLYQKNRLTYLELTFPSLTSKSAYATEQLFILLHTLAGQRRFVGTLLGYKKEYSLEIVASRKSGIRYILAVGDTDVSIVSKSLLSYLPGLKIKEIPDYLPANLSNEEKNKSDNVEIIELKLSNNFVLPLQEHKTLNLHDPIAYLTGNMTKLKTDELMVFQVVVTPVTESSHRAVSKHLSVIRQRIYGNLTLTDKLAENQWQKIWQIPWAVLVIILKTIQFILQYILSMFIAFWDTKGGGSNTPFLAKRPDKENQRQDILNPYESELQRVVKAKIDQPLFESSLRLFVLSDNAGQARERGSGFLASLGSLGSAYQSLIQKKRGLFSFFQRPVAAFSARRMSTGNNPILSASELTDLYHFPYTDTTKTEDLVKTLSSDLPAPLPLKNSLDLDVVFGVNNYGNTSTPIGLSDSDRSRHVYLIGQTGSGKSTIIYHMANDDIKKGRGLAVIDPHGDLAEELLNSVPLKRSADLIYFNPFDIKYPVGLNLLELPADLNEDELELEKELVCESVISIFRRVFSKDEATDAHRIESILRNAIYTAFYVPDCTIFTVYNLLNDPDYQKKIIKGLNDKDLILFWRNEFGKAGDYQVVKMVSGVTAKIGRFLFSPITKRILEQPRSTINFDEILNDGKILICNLAEGKLGEDTAMLLGTTILAKIQQATMRRIRTERAIRRPFYLFVDEFQNFATKSFNKLLSGGRKFGLRITIAEQSTAQQDDRNIVNVILANTGTVICFRTASPIDEDLMLSQFRPCVTEGEIGNLPRYHFYIKLSAATPTEPFSGETLPLPLQSDSAKVNKLIESSRQNYTIKYVSRKEPNNSPVTAPVKKKPGTVESKKEKKPLTKTVGKLTEEE